MAEIIDQIVKISIQDAISSVTTVDGTPWPLSGSQPNPRLWLGNLQAWPTPSPLT